LRYLIDSDIATDYLTGSRLQLQLIEKLMDDGVAMSTISCMELYDGVEASSDPAAETVFQGLLGRIAIFPVSLAVARRCARVRRFVRQQGRRVNSRALDLLIAATALEHNLTLVTRNVDDYRDIPGLQLYEA
jgi:tRNA(fMet)-specific endonuclease VapC